MNKLIFRDLKVYKCILNRDYKPLDEVDKYLIVFLKALAKQLLLINTSKAILNIKYFREG